MTIDVTCPCGKVLKAPISAAGRKGRCKACGATVSIPDSGIPLAATFAPLDPPVDDDADVGSSLGIAVVDDDDGPDDDDVVKASDLPMPREPWYYWGTEFPARLLIYLAIFIIAIFTASLMSVAASGDGSRILAVLGAIMAVFVSMLLVAPVFLVVDLARNVRVLRFIQEQASRMKKD